MCQQLCQMLFLGSEPTTTLGQSRCPMVKLRVVAAEGGQVLDLLLSWRSTCSFIFLVVPMAPELSGDCSAGLVPGHVAGRLQVPSAPGWLVGRRAVSLHLRYERKLFSQGGDVGLRAKLISINI